MARRAICPSENRMFLVPYAKASATTAAFTMSSIFAPRERSATEKALASMDTALAAYAEQVAWRESASTTLAPALAEYEATLAQSIGIRQQDRLTRDQALFVAGCSAEHRDISLSF